MDVADPLAALDAVERRYNGPLPRALRRALTAAGEATARATGLDGLAASARDDLCRLRAAALRAPSADQPPRLAMAAARLAWARERAEAWRRRAAAGGG